MAASLSPAATFRFGILELAVERARARLHFGIDNLLHRLHLELAILVSTLVTGVPSGVASTATGNFDSPTSFWALGTWPSANSIEMHCEA